MHWSRLPRLVRFLVLAIVTVSTVLLHKQATRAQEARPGQNGQVTLPPVDVSTSKRAKQPKGKKQVAKRAPPIVAPPPPKVESATGPVPGYLASRSATGIKTDTPLKEIPQSISVVTADRVTDQGVATVQQSLRYVPGVFADAYGPDSRGDYPRVRGSDPEIYLDGMRLANSGKFNEARLDPYMFSRIEVLRGPSSVLYGSTTTAGIINLVSKRPQEEAYREIGVQYGSFNRKQIQTDMTGKLTADGEWLYRFVGIARDSDTQTDFVKDDRVTIAPSIT
jgi:iron complex outermembrane receptor protein